MSAGPFTVLYQVILSDCDSLKTPRKSSSGLKTRPYDIPASEPQSILHKKVHNHPLLVEYTSFESGPLPIPSTVALTPRAFSIRSTAIRHLVSDAFYTCQQGEITFSSNLYSEGYLTKNVLTNPDIRKTPSRIGEVIVEPLRILCFSGTILVFLLLITNLNS